nr:MAG TPA: hypothetical protein [Caudoviricetes sp.]
MLNSLLRTFYQIRKFFSTYFAYLKVCFVRDSVRTGLVIVGENPLCGILREKQRDFRARFLAIFTSETRNLTNEKIAFKSVNQKIKYDTLLSSFIW